VQVQWLHNNLAVHEGCYERVSDDRMHALHISQVTAADAGTFTAVASNSLGRASHSAKLSVDSRSWKRHEHTPVNGSGDLQRRDEHGSSHSPRSSDREQTTSARHLAMRPGCLVAL